MSLPACQERVLNRIEHSLTACDPRLWSMFAIFTKLTGDEEMPRLEELESRPVPLRGWLKRLARPGRGRRTVGGAQATGAPGTALRAILLVPIMLPTLAPAALLGFRRRSVSRFGPGNLTKAHRTRPEPGKTGLALPQRLMHQWAVERMTG